MMPGTRLLAFASRWFEPAVVASVLEPLVADWQRECADAAPARRRMINVRGHLAFALTAIMMTPRLALSPNAFRARPIVVGGGFWVMTSSLLSLLFALPWAAEGMLLRSCWLFLPASLTLMLPFAMLPAIDAMRRDDGEPTHLERRAALTLVAGAVLGVVLGQGWLTPAANQRWRNEMMTEFNGRPTVASRGVNEVTTGELIAGDVAILPALHGTPRVRELNMRLSLALLPAVLAWLRWRSLSRVRKRAWPVVTSCLLAIAATGAFIFTMPASVALERLFLAPGFGPLLVLGLFAVTTRTGIWWRQRAV